jgi:hypothetical protein
MSTRWAMSSCARASFWATCSSGPCMCSAPTMCPRRTPSPGRCWLGGRWRWCGVTTRRAPPAPTPPPV